MSSESSLELTQLSLSNDSSQRLEKKKLISSQEEEANATRDFILHLSLLLKKNYLIHKRSLKSTLFQILSPFLATFLLFCWQYLSTSITSQNELDSPISQIQKLERCFYSYESPNDCFTITYGVIGKSEPWIDYVLDFVANANDLNRETDFNYLGEIEPIEFSGYLRNNMNHTKIGVLFCTGEWTLQERIKIPCHFETHTDNKLIFYSIIYNTTRAFASNFGKSFQTADSKDPVATSLKMSIDNGIARYFARESEKNEDSLPLFEIFTQDFPKTYFRFFVGVDMVSRVGPFHYFIPFMICFIMTVLEIVREKHKRLRQGLAVMGLTPFAYWTSWILTVMVLNFFVTINILISGNIFGFGFFTDTPNWILFWLFYLFGVAMQAFAFFISTLCADLTSGYSIAYGFLLIGFVLEFLLGNIFMVYLFYLKTNPAWFINFRKILELYPAFHYSKIFGDIALESGGHYDTTENKWVRGKGFTYADLDTTHEGKFPFTEDEYSVIFKIFLILKVPPPRFFFWKLFFTIFLYLSLTWYFDNVISHNRGTSKPFLFFLQKEYWLGFFQKKNYQHKTHAHHHLNSNYDDHDVADSVKAEKERVLENNLSNNECQGLRIIGLNKIFESSKLFFRSNRSQVHAVKDCYLEVDGGELLSILGHNGAGKTTLIGVLTGVLNPSSGTAEMCDFNIIDEMESIRKIMGVCPQFDILWDDLTAEEHLYMFSKLKKIPDHLIPREIEQRLKEVNLIDVKKARAGTFSGGMKRRLSMAIAFTGNPKIVFLDEPTTGMDPKNRRYIWDLILKMKKGRAVILTTHAMEEADVLSDRIAVIVDGSMKCIGTPLYLKNNFGDGYRLSLVVNPAHVETTIKEVIKIIPSGKILDQSGGSIIIGVPLLKINELKNFFRIMEGKEEDDGEANDFKGHIKDWGLSNTTLEEVFMRVIFD